MAHGLRFRFLTGDVNWQTYGGKFISRKLNNGEFDYWLVMDVLNWEDATGEKPEGNTYCVSLYSVSPSEAGSGNLKRAFDCCGMESMDKAILDKPEVQVEALVTYGVYAQLWSASGTNLTKLMRECRNQANAASGLYGFYMDRAQNRIGTSGWEMQRGDLDSAINRIKSSAPSRS